MAGNKQMLARIALAVGVFALIAGFFWAASHRVSDTAQRQSMAVTEQGIRRAVVQCYAVEGRYPESIEYLEKNYGLYVDHTRYSVAYTVHMANLMPQINVYEWPK